MNERIPRLMKSLRKAVSELPTKRFMRLDYGDRRLIERELGHRRTTGVVQLTPRGPPLRGGPQLTDCVE